MEHGYPFHIHAPGHETAEPPLCGREDVPLSAIVAPHCMWAVDCPACCAILGAAPAVRALPEGGAPDLDLVAVDPDVVVAGDDVSICVTIGAPLAALISVKA